MQSQWCIQKTNQCLLLIGLPEGLCFCTEQAAKSDANVTYVTFQHSMDHTITKFSNCASDAQSRLNLQHNVITIIITNTITWLSGVQWSVVTPRERRRPLNLNYHHHHLKQERKQLLNCIKFILLSTILFIIYKRIIIIKEYIYIYNIHGNSHKHT